MPLHAAEASRANKLLVPEHLMPTHVKSEWWHPQEYSRVADVFVSYATPNRQAAERLASVLQKKGVTIWWDKNLAGGDRFRDAIQQELGAAKCVLVLWSKDSIKSRFVLDEADIAAATGKLCSLLLEALPATSIPLGFRSFHALSFNDICGIEQALMKFGVHVEGALPANTISEFDLRAREDTAWAFVMASRDPALVEEFLRHFPDSKHSAAAMERRKLLGRYIWQGALTSLCGLIGGALVYDRSHDLIVAFAGFWGASALVYFLTLPFFGDTNKTVERHEEKQRRDAAP